MQNKQKKNPFAAYAVASQVGFIVITPLLVFIWGGSWLVNRFSLPNWLMIVFIVLGVVTMLCSLITYLMKMIKMYGGDEKPKETDKLSHDKKDHDFYEE